MKKLFGSLVLIFVAGSVVAADFRSAVITGTALTIKVPDGHFVMIRNFTQEGGTVRGVVTVALSDSSGATTATANVLNAAMIDNAAAVSPLPTPANAIAQPDTINGVTVAGPATVTVPPVPGAVLFITYRKETQPDA